VEDVEKLITARKELGFSQGKMGHALGLDRAYISQLENGHRAIKPWVMERLEVLLEEKRLKVNTQATSRPRNHGGPFWGTTNQCPIISWASAGNPAAFEDQGLDVAMVATDCRDSNCYALQIDGDSMQPRFEPGDYAIVMPNTEAKNGDLVIAKTIEGDIFFKLYHRVGRSIQTVRLTSYNPAYPPMDLNVQDLSFVHPVHSVIRKLRKN